MNERAGEEIREANLRLDEALARQYDRIHPHLRNALEQQLQRGDMGYAADGLSLPPGRHQRPGHQ